MRTQPNKIFEHYVLTRTTAPNVGLSEINDDAFLSIGNVSTGFQDDATSGLIPLGFDFEFDQTIYKNIVINTNGWIALADPTAANSSTVQSSLLLSSSWQNEGVNLTNSSKSVLLCPWFDDLRNVAQISSQASTIVNSDARNRQLYGFETPSIAYNQTEYATKIYYQTNSPFGRRTIIRWNSLSDYSNASTVIKFEAILYENGKIEFRYQPRKNLSLFETRTGGNYIEDATVGIFASGSNRFRDFSLGLGYLDGSRQQYKYGGAQYDPNFTDQGYDTFASTNISRNYTWRLRPASHWPGSINFGTILTFNPPLNRRKILPRNLIRIHDSKTYDKTRFYDDRRSATFISNVVVNYPTTLQRFFGDSEIGVSQRQDLFLGSDNEFLITGSIVKSAIDQYVDVRDDLHIKPFGEHQRFDLDTKNIQFFKSGSSLDVGEKYDTPLWSKTQVRFSLPVHNTTKLFETKAAIYYYNSLAKTWLLPDNSTATGKSDIANPINDSLNSRVLEDHRGFGPIGNIISSGSLTVVNTGSAVARSVGSDVYINHQYTQQYAIEALFQQFEKSVTINQEYAATNNEVIQLQITEPFLLESAVVEIPFAAGEGWFNTKTTSFLPLTTTGFGAFDFAGPGLTFALFHQVKMGSQLRRDLILTGTITHNEDLIQSIACSNFPSLSSEFQIRPEGYLSYASEPSGVVKKNYGSTFTGSVTLKTEPLASNGVVVRMSKDMNSGNAESNRTQVLNLVDQEYLTIVSGSGANSIGYNIAYVNSFGRGATNSQSGRSIFGKEYVTTQNVIVNTNKIKNPFYLTGSSRTNMSSSIAGSNTFRAVAAIPLISHVKAPYILLPGDTLVLAIAKSRPYYYSNYELGGPESSGSIQHDLQLITGSINVSLFGSLQKEGKETFKQTYETLNAPNIHDVIGNDVISDQYDTEYLGQFVDSIYDDYVTGSLVSVVNSVKQTKTLITGSRGKVFSKFYARNQQQLGTSSVELLISPSKAIRLQPWWERDGNSRIVNHFDSTERIYDSLMPSISECFKADGTGIWMVISSSLGASIRLTSADTNGYIIFDQQGENLSNDALKLRNGNWTKAFPYESRYSTAPRQKYVENSFVATQRYEFASGSVVVIEPTVVNNIFIGTRGPGKDGAFDIDYFWFTDVNLAATGTFGHFVTGSMLSDDIVKILYGYGDRNNCRISVGSGNRTGTNNWPDHRELDEFDPTFVAVEHYYAFGPIIRGWKYGVYSGLPSFTKATFRRNRFGQLRDMLEQRLTTKFFIQNTQSKKDSINYSPVNVRFVDANGSITEPENTSSNNLSYEVTSSTPYIDGINRSRNIINKNTQNAGIVSFKADRFGNVSL